MVNIALTQSAEPTGFQKEFAKRRVPRNARVKHFAPHGAPRNPTARIIFPLPSPGMCRSILIGLIAGGLVASAAPPAPELDCGLPVDEASGIYQSTEGVVDLAWSADGAARYQLEEATPEDGETFESRYTGPDASTVRTGLSEGLHRFRVRGLDTDGEPGPWSETLAIQVSYMDRGKVRLLLVLGAVVVVSTIVTILFGHFSQQRHRSP
jgi:hypothetical protein